MSLETLTSIATIGTFVILTASAIAAIVQLQYLAVLAKQWATTHTQGAYPKNFPGMPLTDRWLEADKKFLADRIP